MLIPTMGLSGILKAAHFKTTGPPKEAYYTRLELDIY
jgi:hypothetical protein